MGKPNNKSRRKGGNWLPPEDAYKYFSPAADYDFKRRHPIGYGLLITLAVIVLMLPSTVYLIFIVNCQVDSYWILFGWLGGFIVGIGLFNFVVIIIKQYLGHLVSILSFIIGGILIWLSLIQMGIV